MHGVHVRVHDGSFRGEVIRVEVKSHQPINALIRKSIANKMSGAACNKVIIRMFQRLGVFYLPTTLNEVDGNVLQFACFVSNLPPSRSQNDLRNHGSCGSIMQSVSRWP